mmetsp:Transcript_18655/g.56324  ORF Transcript_18655/g.56324 Transcript_18655/m.56324 type:complete len:115 (-) Transcript_18655:55-399(-)
MHAVAVVRLIILLIATCAWRWRLCGACCALALLLPTPTTFRHVSFFAFLSCARLRSSLVLYFLLSFSFSFASLAESKEIGKRVTAAAAALGIWNLSAFPFRTFSALAHSDCHNK